jgi:hypothetical protein
LENEDAVKQQGHFNALVKYTMGFFFFVFEPLAQKMLPSIEGTFLPSHENFWLFLFDFNIFCFKILYHSTQALALKI